MIELVLVLLRPFYLNNWLLSLIAFGVIFMLLAFASGGGNYTNKDTHNKKG